jgi:hypothetical protein
VRVSTQTVRKKYFQNLFMAKIHNESDDSFEKFISHIEAPVLSQTESNTLEGHINYHEATLVLHNMKYNKSPGSSGFSADFYKVFWKKLGVFVVRAINNAYESGKLSITQTQEIITCISKNNKPKEFLKKWKLF